jgi:VWFA-related protein
MTGRRYHLALVVVSILIAGGALSARLVGSARPHQPPAQQPPAFTAATVLVPVDVRVVDKKTGKPVTDLQQDDFTLLEDGVPQPIRHFEKKTLSTEAAPAAPDRLPVRETGVGLVPQENRIFLFVLGRGRLEEPSKAIDALERMVREQMLPRDHVAVFAYDRATDFTTDHELVAKFLERFKREHGQIDMEVGLAIDSSMAAIYGSRALPKSVQAKIDAMFLGAGTLAYRQVGKGETASTQRAERDVAKLTDKVQAGENERAAQQMYNQAVSDFGAANAGSAPAGMWSAMDEFSAKSFYNLGLDDFMAVTAQSLQDLGNCYAAIEYLRHLDGEKHLVFVTEKGINLPRLEDDLDLTRAANDARVVIDTFQTGGLEGQVGGGWTDQSRQTFAFKALRVIAEQTGGVSSVSEDGMVAVNRINETSRSEYLLGYYPATASLNGAYRKLEVKVRRPDVTVLYRRGFFARRDLGSFNRREFITRDRLLATAGFRREVTDIKLKVSAKVNRSDRGAEMALTATIDPSRLFFTTVEGKRVGSLDVLAVCFDERGNSLGQFYQRANVELTEDDYQKVVKSGLPYSVSFDANPGVRKVRLIVFDYRADLVGSADKNVF